MLRQASTYEKKLFQVIREMKESFYYGEIIKEIEEEQYRVLINKNKGEMIGQARVYFPKGEQIYYEIRFNRIVNLTEGYILHVPGSKLG